MPVQMGNVVIWRPSRTAALAIYFTYKILEEAGVPSGYSNLFRFRICKRGIYSPTNVRISFYWFNRSF
jgi:acyl-CoA reductase-like NAD-dependent aldehyde dehydrogenase